MNTKNISVPHGHKNLVREVCTYIDLNKRAQIEAASKQSVAPEELELRAARINLACEIRNQLLGIESLISGIERQMKTDEFLGVDSLNLSYLESSWKKVFPKNNNVSDVKIILGSMELDEFAEHLISNLRAKYISLLSNTAIESGYTLNAGVPKYVSPDNTDNGSLEGVDLLVDDPCIETA